MKDIVIKTIPVEKQRYRTAGDYWEDEDKVHIKISEQINEDADFLVAVHELIEFYLTKKRGIREEDISDYDINWEKMEGPKADEPGNQAGCPYSKEHRFAENIERQIAHELGVDWFEYNDNLKL